jgi:hypothetical protein
LAACSLISVPTVNASWHKTNTYESIGITLSIRGGSESVSAWNAGSRHDYRSPKTPSYNRGRSSSSRQQSYTVDAEHGSKEQTKEAIATAFLNREDRNRFIGKL